MNNYYSKLSDFVKAKDTSNANKVIMEEIGKSLSTDKNNFIEIIKNAGIEVPDDISNIELVKLFTNNVDNKKLLLGASYLINHKYRKLSFDGQEEISEPGLKATYKVMDDYFNADGVHSNLFGLGKKKASGDGDADSDPGKNSSNGPVAVPTGFGSAIATALGKGAQLGNTLAQNSAQKKRGAQMSLDKSRDAHSQIINGILASRQAAADALVKQKESEAKTLRISLIVGGSVVAIIFGIVLYKKLKK